MYTNNSKPSVQRKKGRKKGVHGVQIQISKPSERPMYTRNITVHDMSVDELYSKIIGLVTRERVIRSIYNKGKDVSIIIKEVNKKNE